MNSIDAISEMNKGKHVFHVPTKTIWALLDKNGRRGASDGVGCSFVQAIKDGDGYRYEPGSCPASDLFLPEGSWRVVNL